MMVLISIEDGFFKEPAMQLKSLRMFLAVCDSGSFGAAAQQLYTVQSNVTAHVKKLEDEAGVQLLERSAPVHATPAGRLLERYARRMLADHDESLALLQGSARAAGSLRIGSMETTAALRLPPLLARLHQGQPGLDLELRTATTAELLADLLAGRLDCAFVSGMPPQPRLQGWKVFEEELVLVTAFALPQFPDAAQLSATPFLAFRQGCSYRQRIELLLAASGVAARIMEMGSLDAILGCVAAGMGFSSTASACTSRPCPAHWPRKSRVWKPGSSSPRARAGRLRCMPAWGCWGSRERLRLLDPKAWRWPIHEGNRNTRRYCMASATCPVSTAALPARSAMVRATLSARCVLRADQPRRAAALWAKNRASGDRPR
jgi:DNA-binding transcriptional LysR family regulator